MPSSSVRALVASAPCVAGALVSSTAACVVCSSLMDASTAILGPFLFQLARTHPGDAPAVFGGIAARGFSCGQILFYLGELFGGEIVQALTKFAFFGHR